VQASEAQLGPSANGRGQAGAQEGALPGAYALVRHVSERTCHAAVSRLFWAAPLL